MRIALLCFGISSIANISGTEKVFVDMSNAFIQRGHIVYSVWNDEPGVQPYYPLDEGVRQVNLAIGKIQIPFLYKLQREICKGFHIHAVNRVDRYKAKLLCQAFLKRINLNDIDIFICYEFNSVMVANRLSNGNIPVIAMVHNSIENQIETLTYLQRKEASKVDVYQVLQPSFVEKAQKLLNTEVCYIPNIVPQMDLSKVANIALPKDVYKIVFIGRINKVQKRPFLAIKAFGRLARKFPNWKLFYYGPITDEAYKKQIDSYVAKNMLQDQIQYKGVTSAPLDILRHADIFAFPSAYEGFGLALGEANSLGIPAIGFSYAAAVKDLIVDGVTGYLAQDQDQYSEKLEILMKDQELRVRMGKNAREYMNQYSAEIIWEKWESLLHRVISRYP